jgi:putative acetyltransferase
MIRRTNSNDIEAILEIWLSASIKAHNFIAHSFWESQLENMKNIYLPLSEVYVYENLTNILGFYALHDDTLAAIFVSPSHQGKGIGNKLIAHAEQQRESLLLNVYKDNEQSIKFYLKHGFECIGEQVDQNTGHKELKMRKSI